MKAVKTSISKLNKMVPDSDSSRVGGTKNFENRVKQYVSQGYARENTTMYYAKTTNVQKAEQKLLNTQFTKNTPHNNVHSKSNYTQSKEGFVYVIKDLNIHN
jgi:hypothetical protein